MNYPDGLNVITRSQYKGGRRITSEERTCDDASRGQKELGRYYAAGFEDRGSSHDKESGGHQKLEKGVDFVLEALERNAPC